MSDEASPRQLLPHVNVVIVGAGPAGLGMARVLRDLAVPDVHVFERHRIGASFHAWPESMRFISPSFPGNGFGLTDLNAISFDSSPAYSLKREHPSGPEYARYLEQFAEVFGLMVVTGLEVRGVEPEGDLLLLRTNCGILRARFVIWAAGQFQYPNETALSGAEHGTHSSRVQRWSDHRSDEALVIGGYESGIDAAIGLADAGKTVTVLARAPTWESADKDPSVALSPYTRQRLDKALLVKAITLVGDVDILGLERVNGHVRALAADGRSWASRAAPVLATGFRGSTHLLDEWFAFDKDGCPTLTEQDESTKLAGLFLVGPELKHRDHQFCFIYKFRQRFAVVAAEIATRLGIDPRPLGIYRLNNMYLDDLSCCDDDSCLC